MPSPLAACAFSSSSSGTSTVIFRAVFIAYKFTIISTSVKYGIPPFPKDSYASELGPIERLNVNSLWPMLNELDSKRAEYPPGGNQDPNPVRALSALPASSALVDALPVRATFDGAVRLGRRERQKFHKYLRHPCP